MMSSPPASKASADVAEAGSISGACRRLFESCAKQTVVIPIRRTVAAVSLWIDSFVNLVNFTVQPFVVLRAGVCQPRKSQGLCQSGCFGAGGLQTPKLQETRRLRSGARVRVTMEDLRGADYCS